MKLWESCDANNMTINQETHEKWLWLSDNIVFLLNPDISFTEKHTASRKKMSTFLHI